MSKNRKILRRFVGVALAVIVSLASIGLGNDWLFGRSSIAPALAQRVRPDGVWKLVYEQVPSLPREDRYVSTETRDVAAENTLVGRMIRYHLFVKGRSPFLRFDWKLTLADYLGVNESIEELTYPSQKTLRPSPYEGDVAAIRSLTRAQRATLVQALVMAFSPQLARPIEPPTASSPTPVPSATPTPQPALSPATPQRGPGAAQLLQP